MATYEENDLYRIQSKNVMPVEAAFANTPQAPTELDRPLTREKSKMSTIQDATDTMSDLLHPEDAYPDGGFRAWLVVLGCFLYACTALGWGMNWGVLQDYFHTTMFPDTRLSVLSTIIGVMNFTMNGSAYFFGGLGDRFGYKKMIAISSVLAYLCLLASAFATKVYHLFLFQGAFLGLSQGIAMPLYFSISSQWFYKRRGLATGIAISGTGIGGGVETLIMRQLIVKLGFRKTMIIFSSIHAFIWAMAWFMLKERIPPGTNLSAKKRWLPKINGTFISLACSMFFGVFGYLVPYYFSETYTREKVPYLNPNSLLVTVPLIVMNFSLGLGRITSGRLADTVGPINMFFFSFFFGGLLQMLFWTLAQSYPAIIIFSILNGFIGCWYISLLPVVCASLFGMEGLSTVTGFMILAGSPGQFAGSSIAAAVLSASGNKWVSVTVYSGGLQVLGGLCILYARFKKDRRVFVKV